MFSWVINPPLDGSINFDKGFSLKVAEYRNVSIDILICLEEVLLLGLLRQMLDNGSMLLVLEYISNSISWFR
jgi:hypothetical protein